jgi:hypothetical protein
MLVHSLDNVKRALPSTSWVALYTTLYKTLVAQIDQVVASDATPSNNDFDDEALTGWWDPVGGGLFDLSNWLDSEAPGLDAPGWYYDYGHLWDLTRFMDTFVALSVR